MTSDAGGLLFSRRRRSIQGAWVAGLVAVLAAGCDQSAGPSSGGRPVPANRVLDFATLFSENCAGCHGADGKLGPAPPLNDPIFLAIVPDSVLMGVISEGRPGTPMPAFSSDDGGPLTNDQVKVLAEGIKPRWRASEAPRTDLPKYTDSAPKSRDGQVERGRLVFTRACTPCHGSNGEGKAERAGAVNDPTFLALISDDALRRLAITGRPDLGMPDFASKEGRGDDFRPLSSAEISDLVALLAHWRGSAPERTSDRRTQTVERHGPSKTAAR
jgi:mono/diheme cytochrome c family protein